MRNLQKLKVINIFLFILLVSCQKDFPHKLNTLPKLTKNTIENENIKRVVIGITNNFNSNLEPFEDRTFKSHNIDVGGKYLLQKYVDIARSQIGKKFVLLDTGYFVSKKASESKKDKTIQLYSSLKYDAILFTENELLSINQEVEERNKTQLPFVNSTIYDLKTNSPVNTMGTAPYIIKEVNGVRIAFVGITTYKLSLKDEKEIKGHLFDDPVARLITLRNELRQKSDIIIALLHNKTTCSEKSNEAGFNCTSSLTDTNNLIQRFPPGVVDIILGGESNSPMTMIKGIPVIQNYGNGKYLGMVEVYYDTFYNKVAIDKTKAYEPIKLCSHFFESTQDCNTSNTNVDRMWQLRNTKFKTIPAKFLDKKINL